MRPSRPRSRGTGAKGSPVGQAIEANYTIHFFRDGVAPRCLGRTTWCQGEVRAPRHSVELKRVIRPCAVCARQNALTRHSNSHRAGPSRTDVAAKHSPAASEDIAIEVFGPPLHVWSDYLHVRIGNGTVDPPHDVPLAQNQVGVGDHAMPQPRLSVRSVGAPRRRLEGPLKLMGEREEA